MVRKHLLSYFSVFILFFFSTPCLADYSIKSELESGKAVVLIINAPEQSESEQYADWSHYLNQFSTDVGKAFVFHKISKSKLKNVLQDSEKYNKNYSMIFMKKGKPDYFYNGSIVEPQVYEFVRLAYQGKPIKPEYLNQFSPQEVSIKLKK